MLSILLRTSRPMNPHYDPSLPPRLHPMYVEGRVAQRPDEALRLYPRLDWSRADSSALAPRLASLSDALLQVSLSCTLESEARSACEVFVTGVIKAVHDLVPTKRSLPLRKTHGRMSFLHDPIYRSAFRRRARLLSLPSRSRHHRDLLRTLNAATKKRAAQLLRAARIADWRGIEASFRKNKTSKVFWSRLHRLRKASSPSETMPITHSVFDSDGNLVSSTEEVLRVWEGYYRSVYWERPCSDAASKEEHTSMQRLIDHALSSLPQHPELDKPFSMSELENSIKTAGSDKAVGPDDLPYELFKQFFVKSEFDPASNARACALLSFFNLLLLFAIWPSSFCDGIIVPLFKRKGSRLHTTSYRPISLLSCFSKIYEYLLLARLSRFVETHSLLSEEQAGFRPTRSTLDQLLVLDTVITTRSRAKAPVWLAFLDISRAYDSTYRTKLFARLLELGINGAVFRSIYSMYKSVRRAVRIGSYQSDYFDTTSGVPQGAILSPLLYDIFIDPLARRLHARRLGVRVGSRLIPCLLYADDVVLLARSARELQCMLDVCTDFAREFRLDFSSSKSNAVALPRPASSINLTLQGFSLSLVEEYPYLGVETGRYDGRSIKIRYETFITRIAAEAKRRTMETLAVCGRREGLSSYIARLFFLTHVLGRLNYASQLFAVLISADQRKALDSVQDLFARCSLHLPRGAPSAFTYAELGLLPLWLRHEELCLRYFGKVASMPPTRLPRYLLDQYLANSKTWRGTWFHKVVSLIRRNYPQLEYACSGSVHLASEEEGVASWDGKVREAIQSRWQSTWRSSVANLPSLRFYDTIKESPVVEAYLKDFVQTGTEEKLRLRSGTLDLCARLYVQKRVSSPKCLLCGHHAEDRAHFLLFCPRLAHVRSDFLTALRVKCKPTLRPALDLWLKQVLNEGPDCSALGPPSASEKCFSQICFILGASAPQAVLQLVCPDNDDNAESRRFAFSRFVDRLSRTFLHKLVRLRFHLISSDPSISPTLVHTLFPPSSLCSPLIPRP